MSQRLPFYTVGHSNLDLKEFIALLQNEKVQCVVDVRRIPCSRKYPHFNKDLLCASLASSGIEYRHFLDLGGRRSRQHDIDPDVNGFWDNVSFHNYADYALQPAFQAQLRELIELGHKKRCAIMCAESVWWRCHRRIITDYLLTAGETVRHIMNTRTQDASLNNGAAPQPDGRVFYPTGRTFGNRDHAC